MGIVPIIISFIVGFITNSLYNRIRYYFGKPKITVCNYLLQSTKETIAGDVWNAFQFKIINHTSIDIIDVKLSLRVVKFNDNDRVSKHIFTITRQEINSIKAKEPIFKKNKTYPNAIVGKFFIPCDDIFEIINNKLQNGFDHIEIFIQATNPFTGSIYTNTVIFTTENILNHFYTFQLGHNCTPRKDENRQLKPLKYTKKEILKHCPFVN